jgi:mRNA interferase RelE/StbE
MKKIGGSGDIHLPKSKNSSAWRLEITPRAAKELRALGSVDQARVRKFLKTRIEGTDNPRAEGKPLGGGLSGFWRYRSSNIRILCRLEEQRIVVVVVTIAHRREVYR